MGVDERLGGSSLMEDASSSLAAAAAAAATVGGTFGPTKGEIVETGSGLSRMVDLMQVGKDGFSELM